MEIKYNTKVCARHTGLKKNLLSMGLFSIKNLKKGEVAFIAKGKRFKDEITTIEESIAHRNAIGISKDTWLDPFPDNALRYVNHSCNPNLGIKGSVTFVALRNIKAGEQLTIDYSITECDKLWNFKIQTGMVCQCGYAKCRKVIKSIQFLPLEIYKKYLPYIPKNFQKEYSKEV
jgi:SET domain-containing protein